MHTLCGYNLLYERSARAAAGGEDCTPLPGLRPKAVLGRHTLDRGHRGGPRVGQLALVRELRRAVVHEAHRGGGRLLHIQRPHPLNQQRAHGDLLPGGGARDQAGGASMRKRILSGPTWRPRRGRAQRLRMPFARYASIRTVSESTLFGGSVHRMRSVLIRATNKALQSS